MWQLEELSFSICVLHLCMGCDLNSREGSSAYGLFVEKKKKIITK